MSYKLTSAAPLSISSSSSVSSDDNDERCSDWASSFGDARQTKSLFDDTVLSTQELALQYDQDNWDFDLKEVCEKLGLDMFGRIRLINLIRNAVSWLLIGSTAFFQKENQKLRCNLYRAWTRIRSRRSMPMILSWKMTICLSLWSRMSRFGVSRLHIKKSWPREKNK